MCKEPLATRCDSWSGAVDKPPTSERGGLWSCGRGWKQILNTVVSRACCSESLSGYKVSDLEFSDRPVTDNMDGLEYEKTKRAKACEDPIAAIATVYFLRFWDPSVQVLIRCVACQFPNIAPH